MGPDFWLRILYALNILILVPVCWAMFSGQAEAAVFQGAIASSAAPGLEFLIGSLWLSILIGSGLGLAAPRLMMPLLAVQVVYKGVWLASYVLPALIRGDPVPTGITACFAAIVVIWPLVLWAANTA